ncbi:uncharacterized protein LOC128227495 [Mya arenaria]|uniref:uncharacterized protein LOC128227495 n=1 Tax=Mya arenaria TaxID=6604 RepID=UPI0022E52509|nr:uncharacterized protein LOC128227495 [Mya arenaria]
MDERVGSVMRVLTAMEELDHSELTRGNVKAASRAVDSINNELRKETGVESVTANFVKLLSLAEKGNWTELRHARDNGIMPNARLEMDGLVSKLHKTPTPSPGPPGPQQRMTPIDRGYPPQHTAESEKEFLRRKREKELQTRDRRRVEPTSYSATPPTEYDRNDLRRRDDPKQVNAAISQLASERLRGGRSVTLADVATPQNVASMFTEVYNREWTTAYEELNKVYRDGAETIQHLTKILQNAYDFCLKYAESQIMNMLIHVENEMLYPNISKDSRSALEAQVRPDRSLVGLIRESDDMVREYRKYGAAASLPVIKWMFYEDVLKTIHHAQHPTNAQIAFIDRCIDVCWLMATQNAPMHLEFCRPGDRPSSYFRPLTRMGNSVQNCVWPALFLHKGGKLMEKGVAHLA